MWRLTISRCGFADRNLIAFRLLELTFTSLHFTSTLWTLVATQFDCFTSHSIIGLISFVLGFVRNLIKVSFLKLPANRDPCPARDKAAHSARISVHGPFESSSRPRTATLDTRIPHSISHTYIHRTHLIRDGPTGLRPIRQWPPPEWWQCQPERA